MIKPSLIIILIILSSLIASAQFMRGVTWEDNRYNALPVYYGGANTLPASKSLKVYYPKVVVQPEADYTDVAWAAVWNARTAAEAIACTETDPLKIRQLAFAPAYNYALIRKTPDCSESVSIVDLLESLVKNGTPYFSEFNEICAEEIPSGLASSANTKKLSGFIKLFNTSDGVSAKIQSVKSALVSNNAVVAGIICPSSFNHVQEVWQPRESQPDREAGGHAICVVGYDDTKFGGAFEIVNTWGKEWGKDGFTWIRYQDFANYTQYGFGLFQVAGASCNVPFEAHVTFKQLSSEEMRTQAEGLDGQYKFWTLYPTGTTFTIQISSNVPAFVYSFGLDPAGSLFPLFPRSASTVPITFAPLRAPDDMPAITLTDPPGRNFVYFIFSPSAIDLAKAVDKLKGRKVIAPNDIYTAIGMLKSSEPIKWNLGGTSFSGRLNAPVVMQVTLDQTTK